MANRTTTTTTTTTPSANVIATTTTITNRPHTLVLLTQPYPVPLFQDGGGVSGAASLILQPVLQYGKSGCVHNPLMYDDLVPYLLSRDGQRPRLLRRHGNTRDYHSKPPSNPTRGYHRKTRATPRHITRRTFVHPTPSSHATPRKITYKSALSPIHPAAGTAQRRRGGRGHHVAYRHHRRDLDGNT